MLGQKRRNNGFSFVVGISEEGGGEDPDLSIKGEEEYVRARVASTFFADGKKTVWVS